MTIEHATNRNHSRDEGRYGRLPLYLLLAGLVLLILGLGFKGYRLLRLAQSFQQHQVRAEALTQAGLVNVDPGEAEALVMDLRRDVVSLDREVGWLLPLGAYLTWAPRIGPLLGNGEALMEMADAGSEAAAYAVRGLKPALLLMQDDRETGSDLLRQLMPILEQAEADLFAAGAALDRVVIARQRIQDVEQLPWRVRTLLEQIDGKLYLADELKLLAVLPVIMGRDEPRTYLILAQNEDEARATGGFISGVGLLTLADGRIVALSFEDGYRVDDWRNKPYNMPPAPLYELMGLELFLFRDANYWPDFPTSAEQAMQLYDYGQQGGPELDGAIAIDQQFVAMLLSVTGPLNIAELEMTVNSSNALARFREAWAADEGDTQSDWIQQRKDFLGPLAQGIQQRLLGNFRDIDPLYLADIIYRAVEQKRLQFYVREPRVAAVLDEINWDGRVEPGAGGDFLMLVETNVGYNKVASHVERHLTYEVALREDGSGAATLTLDYTHNAHPGDEPCSQFISYALGTTYESLMERCYWSYVRVYGPPGITLVRSSEHELPPGATPIGSGWQSARTATLDTDAVGNFLANAFVLPRGERLTSTFVYELPPVVEESEPAVYRLNLLKQAGMAPYAVTVHVTAPEGATVMSTSPQAMVNDRQVTFHTELASDVSFELTYR